MNYRIILNLMGRIMIVEALFMLPPLAIAVYCGEWLAVRGFLIAVALLAAVAAWWTRGGSPRGMDAREGFVTVGLVWLVVSLFGAIPFYASGAIPSYIDCVFETVSGFTTTGSSILTDVEALPQSLLYWRSFTHWVGGMGVLVSLLAVAPARHNGGDALHLLRAESPGPQVDKLVPRMHQTAKILYGIYVVMTAVQIVLLLAGGMPLFDAVTTSFGTAGTGGFGIKNDSLAGYSPYIQTVTTVFMALFGVNFSVYYLILTGAFSKALFNEEVRVYFGIMLAAIAVITWNILPMFGGDAGQALHHAAFQVSSVMTTTGFSTIDFNLWPEFSRAVLTVLMILGACAGSTGGGIKTARLIILFKSAKKEISQLFHPRSVKLARMDGHVLSNDTVHAVNAYMSVYMIVLAASALLVSLDELSLETNLTAVLSCLNNIGPGLGMVGPMSNFSVYSDFSKIILTADMLIGRLEIFPVLALFAPSTWRR